MKVKFKREGGFAGMTLRREVEHSDLPQDAKQALRALQGVGQTSPSPTQRRDGFLYTIEVEREAAPVVVALDEASVPQELAPLIRYFEALP